jgi:leucyl aminopeptidase
MKDFVRISAKENTSTNKVWLYSDKQEITVVLEQIGSDTPAEVISQSKKSVFPLVSKTGYHFLVKVKTDDRLPQHMENYRIAGDAFQEEANKLGIESAEIMDFQKVSSEYLAFAEGCALGNYNFEKYKAVKKNAKSLAFILLHASSDEVNELNTTIEFTCLARDLVNEPYFKLTALKYSELMESLGERLGIDITVLHKMQLESLKMGGILGVNKGSQDPPTFTIMEYKPANAVNQQPIVLVGKGIVFDTGGLSLKPTAGSMDMMKCDMAGSAAVLGAICAVAQEKLPIHIITLIPATDNRPGENAITPGDILHMYNGKTVEVLNTDAEGRLVIADALEYAKKYNPSLVIDAATLTGAAAIAIGKYGIVAMGNADDGIFEQMKESGNETYERLAQFPFWDEYNELLESDIADIKNIGDREGGAITAGKFLEFFTDYPYIHLDIAGPAYVSKKDKYRSKNGTGYGVRMLYNFLKKQAQ